MVFPKSQSCEWVLGGEAQGDEVIPLPYGPRVHIIGRAPGDR